MAPYIVVRTHNRRNGKSYQVFSYSVPDGCYLAWNKEEYTWQDAMMQAEKLCVWRAQMEAQIRVDLEKKFGTKKEENHACL